jgi:hypothetical protein
MHLIYKGDEKKMTMSREGMARASTRGRKGNARTRLTSPPPPATATKFPQPDDPMWASFLQKCAPPTLVVPPYLWVGGLENASDEAIEVRQRERNIILFNEKKTFLFFFFRVTDSPTS